MLNPDRQSVSKGRSTLIATATVVSIVYYGNTCVWYRGSVILSRCVAFLVTCMLRCSTL